ncbi:pilus assembly PilX family protein [Aromatoleum anaerobium]|uniref:Pilus assembly protein PilZ n=1 Tax=Aromatoleum anaerobium TaxID=182180 RepID=A0ABX1PMZ4_9RHOO|nr:PilX N-terminal domain-containing pilus assembly protein [Aromatoleum anaerobium]MCK0506287.1 PilX N-terminal domain-containing pilus assembly protein [Aromatoleum anaerobium]
MIMTHPLSPPVPVPRQRGVVLVISLIMLLLLTMLGVSGMRGTTLEERMAGNMRDQNLAFQAAEAALRAGEAAMARYAERPTPAGYPCADGAQCSVYSKIAPASLDLATVSHCWWTGGDSCADNNAIEYTPLADTDIPWATNPRYVIEEYGSIKDTLRVGHGHTPGRDIYRVTARGTGQTDDAEARLQTTYVPEQRFD